MNQEIILFKDECYLIQGAIFDVYKEMGCGFLEAVYHECMIREMELRGIPFDTHKALDLSYKGVPLVQKFIPDFICYGQIIVEIKAVKQIMPEHQAQLLNYLKAAKMKLGMIVNFGAHPQVDIDRKINKHI